MMRDAMALAPGVEQVLPDLAPIPVPIWLTTHRELHGARRIRLVHDILADALSRAPRPDLPAMPLDGAGARP